MDKKPRLLEPIHPVEILREDFLRPMGISINRLARDLDVPPNRIHGIRVAQRTKGDDIARRVRRREAA